MRIEPQTRYTQIASGIANRLNLGFEVYSIASIASPAAFEYIQRCCDATDTRLEEHLKFILASTPNDQEALNLAIGVVRMSDKIDYRKWVDTLRENDANSTLDHRTFSSRHAVPSQFGLTSGRIGIAPGCAYEVYDPTTFTKRRAIPVPYVFDESLMTLNNVCYPIGKGLTDELVVLRGSVDNLGQRLAAFFDELLTENPHRFADVKKK